MDSKYLRCLISNFTRPDVPVHPSRNDSAGYRISCEHCIVHEAFSPLLSLGPCPLSCLSVRCIPVSLRWSPPQIVTSSPLSRCRCSHLIRYDFDNLSVLRDLSPLSFDFETLVMNVFRDLFKGSNINIEAYNCGLRIRQSPDVSPPLERDDSLGCYRSRPHQASAS